jgi:general L-amino acid transport system substrate-binding protein
MPRLFRRALRCAVVAYAAACFAPATCVASSQADVLARVRANGVVHCAGIVRPGIAVPTVDGKHWYGISVDVCRAAAAVFGSPDRIAFRPYFGGPSSDAHAAPDDIVFLSGAQLVGASAGSSAPLTLGPTIVHDALALLVPAAGVAHAADLANKTVCVEPGSPADRALTAYFARQSIALHEHPFQETDEMRQAYGDGQCDALAGPLSTLASVRADPKDGRTNDRLLPELLADDPIFAATESDARWSRVVAWTFAVLVDAEDSAVSPSRAGAEAGLLGVPPAVASELGLRPAWMHDALAAEGDYGNVFARNLGANSRLGLARGSNALWRDGGLIFSLYVE